MAWTIFVSVGSKLDGRGIPGLEVGQTPNSWEIGDLDVCEFCLAEWHAGDRLVDGGAGDCTPTGNTMSEDSSVTGGPSAATSFDEEEMARVVENLEFGRDDGEGSAAGAVWV